MYYVAKFSESVFLHNKSFAGMHFWKVISSRQKSKLLQDFLLPVSHKGIVPGHPTLNLFDSPARFVWEFPKTLLGSLLSPWNDGHELSAISIDNDIILNPNSSCAPVGIYPLFNNEPVILK